MSDLQPGELPKPDAAPRGPHALARFAGPLVLLVLVFAVMGDVLIMPRGRMISEGSGDTVNREIWFRAFGFGHLGQGHLPLWNPHIFGGAPYYGSFATGLMYPPNWLEFVVPSNVAYNWYFALHLYLAGLLTYAVCRARGLLSLPSTLAGGIYILSAPFFLHVNPGHPTVIGGMTWLPLVVLALDRFTDTGGRRWLVAGAAGVAMQIYAGAQHFYLGGIVFGVYAVLLSLTTASAWRARVRPLIAYTAIYGLAILLGAAQLFPALEAKPESARGGGVPIEFAATFSLPPENIATLLSPHLFGAGRDYFGRNYLWEMCLFASVTGLMLACAALAQRDPRRRCAATMVIVALILALGYHSPLFKLLYYYVPGYNTFRGAAKFSAFAALFLAILAAVGLDQLQTRDVSVARRRLIILTCAAGLILIASLVVRTGAGPWGELLQRIHASGESENRLVDLTDPAFAQLSGQHAGDQLLLAFGAAASLTALVWLHGRTRHAAYLIGGLAVLELLVFARRYVATTDAMPPLPAPWQTLLAKNPGDYRVILPAERWANWGMVYGFQNLYGYDSSSLSSRFAEFLAFSQGRDPATGNQYVNFTKFPRYFNLLRTHFVLVPDQAKPYVELSDPLPRALLVPEYEVERDRDAMLARIADPNFDPRKVLLLESEPAIKPQAGGERGSVKVSDVSTDELRIEVDASAPTVLLVTDNYSRFWRATPLAPGPQATYDVLPANRILRAIPLAAGKHAIRLRYEPRGVAVGFAVTGATLVALAAGGVFTLLRPRFGSRSPSVGSDNHS